MILLYGHIYTMFFIPLYILLIYIWIYEFIIEMSTSIVVRWPVINMLPVQNFMPLLVYTVLGKVQITWIIFVRQLSPNHTKLYVSKILRLISKIHSIFVYITGVVIDILIYGTKLDTKHNYTTEKLLKII